MFLMSVNLHQLLLNQLTWAETLDHLQQLCNELENSCSSASVLPSETLSFHLLYSGGCIISVLLKVHENTCSDQLGSVCWICFLTQPILYNCMLNLLVTTKAIILFLKWILWSTLTVCLPLRA